MERSGRSFVGIFAGLAAVAVSVSGCDSLLPTASCDSTLYTDAPRGYGGARLGTPDNPHFWESAGFEIFENHRGGVGDTLQYWNCGVVAVGAWEVLSDVRVGPEWGGETNRGIRMGSSFEEVSQAYPEAVEGVSSLTGQRSLTHGEDEATRAYFQFGVDNKLVSAEVCNPHNYFCGD